MPKPISNWLLRNGGCNIAATNCSPKLVGPQLVQPRKSPDAVQSSGGGGVFDLIESVVSRRVESAHYRRLPRGDENGGVTSGLSTSATL